MAVPDDDEREWAAFHVINDSVRQVLVATDPWEAYHSANGVVAALSADLLWMPHGGTVWVCWSELTDLYEVGDTPLEEAHRVLRSAASTWLGIPVTRSEPWLMAWLELTNAAMTQLVHESGGPWGRLTPNQAGRPPAPRRTLFKRRPR